MNKELIETYLEENNVNDYTIKVYEEDDSVFMNVEGFIFVVEDVDSFSIDLVGDDFDDDDFEEAEEMAEDVERFVKRLERSMYRAFYVDDIF